MAFRAPPDGGPILPTVDPYAIEKRIRANNILPDDIQTLKNNNVYVRHNNKLYGSGSKTAIGQFKQIEKGVGTAVKGWKGEDVA